MLPNVIILLYVLGLQSRHCAADLCNWTGSGFAAAVDSRIVIQVRLRCTEGSVRWIYPGQALRVVLEPNLSTTRRTTVCIKPSPSFHGASVFIERAGELELLVTDGGLHEQQVFCFRTDGPHRPAIYLQSSPQSDGPWNRRTMGFLYELLGNRSAAPNLGHSGLQTSCRPCNDTELLMAICNSDFVVRGSIRNVSHDSERQTSLVEVSAVRVYWQRSGVFEQVAVTGSPQPFPSWRGRIRTLLQCHVKPGDGEFLFTGSEHFGEAWLGCAPRYKDFLSVYQAAWAAHRNSCDFPLD
ncbi:meteorin-like protein [Micropterus dolomieu]|uniref:meteorin-like protein n=1 Tax=Micropterus dolomieu TaxID=147949 RepID=UPI001E8DD0CC|nr:meteorin-like protein [Micropterus dolomieu]